MDFLIPPRTVTLEQGRFTFPDGATIASIHAQDRLPGLQLIDALRPLPFASRWSTSTADATVVFNRKLAITHPQAYVLIITPERIEIASSTAVGAYYATQTLRDLIAMHGRSLPCVVIRDEPDLVRRGFYLDCSRGKVPTVETVRQLVERLARWKINELQLYVENVFTFARHPAIGVGYSPFTPEDICAIEEHCRLHHVSFVPSLTSLGHFEKILMLPGYEDLGELPGFRDLPGGTTLNPLDPRSIALVAEMYADFLPLFSATDFNACGDEPWELGQGRSRTRAQETGLGRVYLDFVLKLRDLSVAHGKRMNLWGDIVLKHPEIIGSLPPELVLLNWEYTPGGERVLRTGEFVDAGLPLVCCPGTHGWQSHGTRLRTSMRNIHEFAGVAVESGAEGLLNTDWGDGGHRNTLGVSLHGAAYGAACSWNLSGVAGPESDEFVRRFAAHTYGDRGPRVARVIEAIGDDDYGYWAYHALLERLSGEGTFGEAFSKARPMIDGVTLDDATLWAKIESADAIAAEQSWRSTPSDSDDRSDFEALALEEYSLANLMNRAAARRVLLARAVRSGAKPAADDVAQHREELLEVRARLAQLWRARSRPSRLADSLAGIDQAIREIDDAH
ncbi:MAG: hypothetical protein EA382_01460 [Spirochaetaceae bacterium]|nr:MAG: hypothetical protein EA382_01460 [Spirochaetaceae bacterium]